MRVLLFAPLLLCAAAASAQPESELTMEQRDALREAIGDRRPAGIKSCVMSRDLRGNRGIGENLIVFKGRTNRSVYINRPRYACPEITRVRSVQVATPGARLCSGDIIQVTDLQAGINYGGCALGDFEEYRR